MSLIQYLLLSIRLKCYWDKAWIISVFTVSNETDEQKKVLYPGKFIREPFGCFYIDEQNQRQPLDIKLDPAMALFRKEDKITLTKQDLSFISEDKIETTIGLLLLNLIVIYEPFEGRLPYINKRFMPDTVENIIAPLLQDTLDEGTPKKPGLYYVDEYLKFHQAVDFVQTLTTVFANCVTRAAMLPAPGRQVFKKEVLKKYEGKLTDPIEMAKFQDELREYDTDYLKKNDPAFGKFTDKGLIDARGKTFMTQGGDTNEFTGQLTMTPIVKSLDEGMDLSPDSFISAANTVRYSSFARGSETVNGGVAAKGLQTALDTWKIVDGDCGSTLGVKRLYDDKSYSKLIQRSVIVNGKPQFIENDGQAKAFIGKDILIRSPQYCRRPGLETCEVCAGEALAKYRSGQIISTMEVSSGIMKDSLKKMHTSGVSSKAFNLSDILS